MDKLDRLLTPVGVTDNSSKQQFDLAKKISLLQRHIGYINNVLPYLRLRYREGFANEVRELGYTLPSFEDENYQSSLDKIESLSEERLNALETLIEEFKNISY